MSVMLSFGKDDRREISGKLMDLGNLSFIALTFGQAFSSTSSQVFIAFLGVSIWTITFTAALIVRKGGKLWK